MKTIDLDASVFAEATRNERARCIRVIESTMCDDGLAECGCCDAQRLAIYAIKAGWHTIWMPWDGRRREDPGGIVTPRTRGTRASRESSKSARQVQLLIDLDERIKC